MEQDVLRPVHASQRTYGRWDFFVLWAGAAFSIAEIYTGGILAPLGFGAGMAAILLGHAIGNTPLALGGLVGAHTGVPAMVNTRPAFGVRGSYLGATLNVIQLLGWTAVMIILGAQATNAISSALVGFDNPLMWKIVIGLATTVWALVGQHSWKYLNAASVALLFLLCLALTAGSFSGRSVDEIVRAPNTGALPFGIGLDIAIAMPISWLPLISDYSRYARNPGNGMIGSWVGYFVASSWMFAVGLIAALATGASDPIPAMLAIGLGVPALLIVLLSTFTTTFMDVYSTGLSALSILPRLSARSSVALGGLLGTALALVFPMQEYESFLLLIGATFIPYYGIVLADFFVLRKRQYDVKAFYGPGKYWYNGGVNWRAIAAYAIGVLSYRWLSGDDPIGLLAALGLKDWVGANLTAIGASIPVMLLAAALYLMFMRVGGRQELSR